MRNKVSRCLVQGIHSLAISDGCYRPGEILDSDMPAKLQTVVLESVRQAQEQHPDDLVEQANAIKAAYTSHRHLLPVEALFIPGMVIICVFLCAEIVF